ncbi:MAG: hypothetical protein AUH92_02290 [Acidobacteria bacterium 13_1_40CM_4_69_4]|nr:MAG: hypothetical protein AUH92_02290 [Acidobacteria bacterium 13_1_40CM_4_69_4]
MDFATGKKRAWRVVRLAVGWALALVGFVLLFLPGPGLLFLLPGLTLLSAESRWVRRLLRRLREKRLVRRAMSEAEKAGIRFDLGPDDDPPDETPKS